MAMNFEHSISLMFCSMSIHTREIVCMVSLQIIKLEYNDEGNKLISHLHSSYIHKII